MALNTRKQEILRAVVDEYIATSEPVSSKTIAERCGLGLSAATVRNEFSALEREAYLLQPHTSAGRIPLDKAYRVYVDKLQSEEDWERADHPAFRDAWAADCTQIESVLDRAVELLHETTGYLAITTSPRHHDAQIEQIKLLRLDAERVLIILAMSGDRVRTKLVRLPAEMTQRRLEDLGWRLEHRLRGLRLSEISLMMLERAAGEGEEEAESLPHLLLLREAYRSMREAALRSCHSRGENALYAYRELGDVASLSKLIDVIKARSVELPYLGAETQLVLRERLPLSVSRLRSSFSERSTDAVVRIGEELHIPGAEGLSVVSVCCRREARPLAYLSVIGPKRMNYRRVLSSLERVRHGLNEFYEKD